MQTIDEVKRHCREVGEGIVSSVAAGEGLRVKVRRYFRLTTTTNTKK